MTRRNNWPFFPDMDRPRRVPIRPIRSVPSAPREPASAPPRQSAGREAPSHASPCDHSHHGRDDQVTPRHAEGERSAVQDRGFEARAPEPSPAAQANEPREAELERLQALVEEKDQHARESAVRARMAEEELERAKERIRKEADKELEQRKRSILLSFVEVLDDLDRALQAAGRGESNAAVVEGVELVRKQFATKLGQFEVTHFASEGETFDPSRHEALSMVPVDEPGRDGKVLGVVREGYLIGEEVLRPAAVAVGKLSR